MKSLLRILASVLVVVFAAASFAACANKNASVTTNDTKEVTTEEITSDSNIEDISSGGWEASELANTNNITAENKALLDKALAAEGIGVGVEYTAVDVIAKQIVAGSKYAFLCVRKAVVPDPVPVWCVLTVYEGLDGTVAVNGITEIDTGSVKTKDNSSADGENTGAWVADVNDTSFSITAAVDTALNNHAGVDLKPIAVLATQLVAGRNYRVLAYGTTVTADPVSDLYVATVYEKLDGTAEITNVSVFDLNWYLN